MANASKKHVGAGAQGKGDGKGALTDKADVSDNVILSNRDKSQHSDQRGQDSKWIQSEQLRDHELNQDKK